MRRSGGVRPGEVKRDHVGCHPVRPVVCVHPLGEGVETVADVVRAEWTCRGVHGQEGEVETLAHVPLVLVAPPDVAVVAHWCTGQMFEPGLELPVLEHGKSDSLLTCGAAGEGDGGLLDALDVDLEGAACAAVEGLLALEGVEPPAEDLAVGVEALPLSLVPGDGAHVARAERDRRHVQLVHVVGLAHDLPLNRSAGGVEGGPAARSVELGVEGDGPFPDAPEDLVANPPRGCPCR